MRFISSHTDPDLLFYIVLTHFLGVLDEHIYWTNNVGCPLFSGLFNPLSIYTLSMFTEMEYLSSEELELCMFPELDDVCCCPLDLQHCALLTYLLLYL